MASVALHEREFCIWWPVHSQRLSRAKPESHTGLPAANPAAKDTHVPACNMHALALAQSCLTGIARPVASERDEGLEGMEAKISSIARYCF